MTTAEYPEIKLYINGGWQDGEGGRGDDIVNPATEEVLGRVPFAEASQVEAANEAFAPSEADFTHAARIIEAYAHATGVDRRGAVMLDDEMIDEASHKMAQVIVARGRAAGFG